MQVAMVKLNWESEKRLKKYANLQQCAVPPKAHTVDKHIFERTYSREIVGGITKAKAHSVKTD